MGSLTSNPDEHPRGSRKTHAPAKPKDKPKTGALPKGKWPKGSVIEIDVTGIVPVPKGSMSAFVPLQWARAAVAKGVAPRAVITDGGGTELKAFSRSLRDLALDVMTKRGLPCAFEQPFEIQLATYHARPAGDFDAHGGLRAKARSEPWTKPDLDKLERTILDSLTGVVYDDDSRVCRVVKQKKYAGPKHDVGLWVRAVVRPATLREQLEWSQQEIP